MKHQYIMAVYALAFGMAGVAVAARFDFAQADKDKDGKLTREEFAAAFVEANPTIPDRVTAWFERTDTDKNGVITPGEYPAPRRTAVEAGSFEQEAAGLAWECVPDPALPNVLILGDSISIGYTLQVRALLKGKANVYRPVRRGRPENCFTAAHGVTNAPVWVGTQKWSVIHFNFGLHDLKYMHGDKLDRINGKQVTTPEAYARCLETVVLHLKKTGARLIFATTTKVPAEEAGRIEGDEVVFNTAALAVMRKHGVAIDDLYTLTAAFPPEYFKKPANVHYAPEGSERLAKQVAGSVLSELAKGKS